MVFSWLKRRLKYEHRKLAIQNFKAAHDPEMKTLAGLYGAWDAFDGYDDAKAFSRHLLNQIISDQSLSANEIDLALNLNKDLRRLYDQIGRKSRGSFDQIYQPFGGWKRHFESNENDANIIEHQDYVEASIERFRDELSAEPTLRDPWDKPSDPMS